jgi:two-component system, NtrC family, sensor histidine kinase HydH
MITRAITPCCSTPWDSFARFPSDGPLSIANTYPFALPSTYASLRVRLRKPVFNSSSIWGVTIRVEMSRAAERSQVRTTFVVFLSRAGGLFGGIAAITVLRYATSGPQSIWHELSLRLYYLPILISAYWYGVPGGLIVALISSSVYVQHLFQPTPTFDASRYAEVVVFHVVGVCVGMLATAQRHVAARYQTVVETLESANRELRDSYEQIRRIDRLKTLGEVATGLAHEIRHPLASIRGALEIIEARAQIDTPEAEFSRLGMAEVDRLDHLVWEFLRYARPHDPELRSVSLHEIVERVVRLLRVETDRAHVRLETEGMAMLEVLVDPLQIEQVLLNVVLNAIQASPAGSRIRIRGEFDQQQAVLDVVDEGPGIQAEHLSNVFSPFFTTRDTGTGLGLAIAQRIVTAHEGRIDVHRTSTRGTCIRIRLPIGKSAEEAVQQVTSEAAT